MFERVKNNLLIISANFLRIKCVILNFLNAERLKASLAYIDLKCQYLRPHAKLAESGRQTVDFAIKKGRYITRQELNQLTKNIEASMEEQYNKREVS